MSFEQINALKMVVFLAEEVLTPDYNPFQDADDIIAHNSIKIIRELIIEQENVTLAQADSEDS
tara:strand:- start:433 stop:621 length:189 start_codon:yes stop_codon:yes gene_type:complete